LPASFAISPDGKTLAVGYGPGRVVTLWDLATGKVRSTLPEYPTGIASLAFSPDGRTLATLSVEGELRAWAPAAAPHRTLLPADAKRRRGVSPAGPVRFAPDGETLAVLPIAGPLSLLDADTGAERSQLRPRDGGGGAFSIAFAPDGKTLAA